MSFLPVVSRELRVASRRWGTYILRLTAASIAIALTALVFFSANRSMPPSGVGKSLFGILSWFAFIYCLFIGIRVTADSISREKRGGTLGLLFLTDLKGYDVVLGKMVAHSLDALYSVVAIVPVLAIPILLGGVPLEYFWKIVVVLLNTLFFGITVGVFASSISVNERKAAAGAFFLVLLFAAGCPVLAAVLENYFQLNLYLVLLPFSPGFAFFNLSVVFLNTVGPVVPYASLTWISVAWIHVMAWLFIWAASMITPKTWQERTQQPEERGWRPIWRQLVLGSREGRLIRRRSLLDWNAATWLSSRNRLRHWWVWMALASCGGFWLWGYSEGGSNFVELQISLFLVFFVHALFKIILAGDAVRIFSDEIRQGSLELLLCTPMTERDIIRGHLHSMRRCFQWPLVAVIGADLLLLAAGIRRFGMQEETSLFVLMFAVGLLVLLVDVTAIAVVGLWNGLKSKNSLQALSNTLGQVMALPWLVFIGTMVAIAFLFPLGNPQPQLLVAGWTILSLTVSLLFMVSAWRGLTGRLRILAATRFGGAQAGAIWTRLGRFYGRLTAPAAVRNR